MTLLNERELTTISGGVSKWILSGIGVGLVFVVSIIYGIIHPNKC